MTWVSPSHQRSKNALSRSYCLIRMYGATALHDASYLFLLFSPQNMIGQSQSGTGKTAAFVLTMLSRVDFSKNQPQVRLLLF
jgi:hypothetical protein